MDLCQNTLAIFMKKNLTILIIFFLSSCMPSPTYNAFDNQFDISIREVIKNGCDTITVGCGFFNLQQKEGRLRNFYQIYVDDWNKVEAKGFSYILDTINVTGFENYNEFGKIKISKQEVKNFNIELIKYNYTFLDQYDGKEYDLRIIENNTRDTLYLQILWSWAKEKDSTVQRTIEYWNPNR